MTGLDTIESPFRCTIFIYFSSLSLIHFRLYTRLRICTVLYFSNFLDCSQLGLSYISLLPDFKIFDFLFSIFPCSLLFLYSILSLFPLFHLSLRRRPRFGRNRQDSGGKERIERKRQVESFFGFSFSLKATREDQMEEYILLRSKRTKQFYHWGETFGRRVFLHQLFFDDEIPLVPIQLCD